LVGVTHPCAHTARCWPLPTALLPVPHNVEHSWNPAPTNTPQD